MWYPAKATGTPVEPVTLEQAKWQCHVDHDDDDDYLTSVISATCAYVEKYTGMSIAEQTVEVNCDSWRDFARLPATPVQSVTSITYIDADGATQTLPDTVYELRSDAGSIVLKAGQGWPMTSMGDRIKLTAVVGGDAPPDVKHAMLLYISGLNDNREGVPEDVRSTFDNLLANHRYDVS